MQPCTHRQHSIPARQPASGHQMSTACAPGTSERRSKYSCNTDEMRPDEHGMRAKVVLAAVSCESRAAAAVDTPAQPVDDVAVVLDGRESVAVDGREQPSLSQQARGALRVCREAGGPAGPWRRSPAAAADQGPSHSSTPSSPDAAVGFPQSHGLWPCGFPIGEERRRTAAA